MDNPCSRALSRRTIITAAAWSVPVIAVAGAVPAIAASTTCKPRALTLTRGTWTKTGTLLSSQVGYTGWLPARSSTASGYATGSYVGDANVSGFTSGADANSGGKVVITVPYTFTAVANTSYTIVFSVVVGYGSYNNSNAYSERQSVVVEAVPSGSRPTTTGIGKVSLVHTNTVRQTDATMKAANYTLMTPADGKKTFSGVFLASTSGTVTVRYTFTLDQRMTSNQVNDDIWISDPVVTPTTC